ncbi:MAG: phosphoserine phosphatase SerB [Planctomycetota bacterium]
MNQPEAILLHVSGEDRPGITARLTAVLAEHDVQMLDMNQAVIHRTMLLGMLVRLPREANDANLVFPSLLAACEDMGLQLRMTTVSDEAYHAWVDRQGLPRFILTLLAPRISAAQVAAVSHAVAEAGLNIAVITRLTGRPSLRSGDDPRRACMELALRGEPADESALRATLLQVSRDHQIDLAWQRDNAFRRNRRLVAFDMDRVLVEQEVLHELAREMSPAVAEQDGRLLDATLNGEIPLEESLPKRVAQLEGLPAAALDRVYDRLEVTDGAERLIYHLKRFGYKTAMISGSFEFFAQRLKQRFGIDYHAANKLEVAGGELTGRLVSQTVTGKRKADLLRGIASIERIDMEQVIAVGDGPNDLPMLASAGLGIAFHASSRVQDSARYKISTLGLDSILYLIGVRDRDLDDDSAQAVSA